MNRLRRVAVSLLVIASLYIAPNTHAGIVDVQVYKGALRIIVHEQQTRNTLTIRYRSKTREVVRIAINGLMLTNLRTQEIHKLADRSASLEDRIDREGYWNTDIVYSNVNIGQDDYRINGRLTLHLVGSQRTSDFSAYLQAGPSGRPVGSSIDWGLGD